MQIIRSHLFILGFAGLGLFSGCSLTDDEPTLVRQEMVIFASNRGGEDGLNLWMMTPNGKNLRQLTHYAGARHYPLDISPDGKQVLFYRHFNFHQEGALFLMPIDGPEPELEDALLQGIPYGASFFPDGERIAVQHGQNLHIFDLRDSSLTDLRMWKDVRDPEVSPDGRLICFGAGESRESNDTQIFLMNADGSGARAISPMEPYANAEACTFSPDGKELVYYEMGDFYRCDLKTEEIQRIKKLGSDHFPAFDTSGTRLFYRLGSGEFADEASEIAVMNLDGSNEVLLTNDDYEDDRPVVGVVEFWKE